MSQKLYLPGISDGSYDLCKRQFERAKDLLEEPDRNKDELSQILQTLKKNPPGARLLAAEFSKEYDSVYDRLVKIGSRPSSLELTLDLQPADSGEKRTQDAWFDYLNKVTDGRVMASMGDFYSAFKQLKRDSEQGTNEEKALAKTLLASLQQDFDWPGQNNWLISSTRVVYRADSLEGTITQHYRCKRPELIKETQLLIPVYRDSAISQVANSSDGLKYLQTLHDAEDDPETMIRIFEFISGKNRNQIKVWTAATDETFTRRSHPNRAAGFVYDFDDFLVLGDSGIYYLGRSRGVNLVSPKGTH